MPAEGVPKKSHLEILRYEEILEIAKAAILEGVFRVRITGGEPLVRKGLVDFAKQISALAGLTDLSLTTNGILFEENAKNLFEAGIKRVNISIDSLKKEKYREISRGGELDKVLAGIEAALRIGFSPVKLNVVLIPGVNDDEILSFAEAAFFKPLHVRFIEKMSFAKGSLSAEFCPQERVLNEIKKRFELIPDHQLSGGGPAQMFRVKGGKGKIGFISPRTHPFCSTCTRLRLTADGNLIPCLDSSKGENVRNLSIPEIREIIRKMGKAKSLAGKVCPNFSEPACRSLSDIGG